MLQLVRKASHAAAGSSSGQPGSSVHWPRRRWLPFNGAVTCIAGAAGSATGGGAGKGSGKGPGPGCGVITGSGKGAGGTGSGVVRQAVVIMAVASAAATMRSGNLLKSGIGILNLEGARNVRITLVSDRSRGRGGIARRHRLADLAASRG